MLRIIDRIVSEVVIRKEDDDVVETARFILVILSAVGAHYVGFGTIGIAVAGILMVVAGKAIYLNTLWGFPLAVIMAHWVAMKIPGLRRYLPEFDEFW